MAASRKLALTQDVVDRLTLAQNAPAGSTDHFIWDADKPSFGVRLRPTKNVYVVQYRVGRLQRRESLGDTRKITLRDARKAAGQRFAKIELGVDPAAEIAAQRRRDSLVFRLVADRYLEARKADMRSNTWNAAQRYFDDYWRPLHKIRVDEITHKTIAEELSALLKKRGRTAVARARANLSALFTWAMKEGLAPSNPVINTNNPTAGVAPRDRVLEPREIRTIWKHCRDDDFGRIVKLLLLTACRRDEIGGLRWEELDLTARKLAIPAGRTKGKKALLLPLPEAAVMLLKECPKKDGREFVFGQWGGAFSRWAWEKMALDKRMAEAGDQIGPWRLHDLRRTAATRMAHLEVPPHVIEAVLNHATGSKVARTYNHYTYEPEKLSALTKWADALRAIVEGGRLIALPRSA